jgi:hypothetical protein
LKKSLPGETARPTPKDGYAAAIEDFSHAVASVQYRFDSSAQADYVRAGERVLEAQAVGPCVWRMAYGELDRTGAFTASRTGLPGSPPSLASKLGSRLSRAPLDTHVSLVEAIYRATALGYNAWLEQEANGPAEARRIADRSIEDVWAFWSADFRQMLETVTSKAWASGVRTAGAESLVQDLKSLKLARLLGGSKVNQLGMVYSTAGVWLRVTQTDSLDQTSFRGGLTRAGIIGRSRAFDAYPAEDPAALEKLR